MHDAYRELTLDLGARRYPIRIGAGLLADATRWRDAIPGRQVLIVSNTTVAPLYLERVRSGLREFALAELILPDGEAHKSLETCALIFAALAAQKASRNACVVALGGGVIGDIAGFAAACWMRGVAFVQMPTTLLAMVDSSVGGKTGVNLAAGKNLIGAFHQPRAVIADTSTLSTLPDREFKAGLAEVVKYAAIADPDFFTWLERHTEALLRRDGAQLVEAIARCCAQKAAIVARDEREEGERALLNFGHTFGHALETASAYGLLHGEAVAIGMSLAASLSARLGRAPWCAARRLVALLSRFGLPTTIPNGLDADALIELMRLDKKNLSGDLRLILWRDLGAAEIVAATPWIAVRSVLTAGR